MHEASGRTPAARRDGSSSTLTVSARGRAGPLPGAAISGGFSVFFLVEAFMPFNWFRLVLGVACGVLCVRLAGRFVLVTRPEGVEWHTFLRTRRWPNAALDHFEVAERSGPSPDGRRVTALRVHLADGSAHWLTGLEAAPGRDVRSPGFSWPDAGSHDSGLGWLRAEPVGLEDLADELNVVISSHDATARVEREAG